MTLYAITEDVMALDSLIESCLTNEDGSSREPTDEEQLAILAMIGETESAFKGKAESICRYRANLMADISEFKKEEERLTKRRKTIERKVESLRIYLEIAMDKIHTEKIEAGTFRLRLQKNPPAVSVMHEDLIDARYFRTIPETREVAKDELKKDFPVGEYPWGMIFQRKSLRIE